MRIRHKTSHRVHTAASIALVLWAAVVVGAQAGHITPFTGTWKLNLAKSSFNPGPPFKSFTLTFTPDGTRHLDLIYADGRTLDASLPWSDGKEVSVTASQGFENATAVSKIQGRTFNDTWRQRGKTIEKVHAAVSPDGRTLGIRVHGTDTQGRAFHNRLVFERQ
jgi:hypothetical protein